MVMTFGGQVAAVDHHHSVVIVYSGSFVESFRRFCASAGGLSVRQEFCVGLGDVPV